MNKNRINSKLLLKKEVISALTMADFKGNGVPTQYENKSQMLTYAADGRNATGNCGEVCWNMGTHGLCTDELATC
jgi:hypothetical protein